MTRNAAIVTPEMQERAAEALTRRAVEAVLRGDAGLGQFFKSWADAIRAAAKF